MFQDPFRMLAFKFLGNMFRTLAQEVRIWHLNVRHYVINIKTSLSFIIILIIISPKFYN